jgi:hypothetical protein
MTTTTAPDAYVDADRAVSRQERLAAAVRALRTRAGGTDPARILLLAGSVLVPLGGVLIILGWWGASHSVWVYEQIPYAISGGLLGLALVFGGAFCYFAYWLSQIVFAVRRDAEETRGALERIEALLAAQAAPAPQAAPGRVAAPAGRAATFLATPNGTVFHRPDCPTVDGRNGVRRVRPDNGLAPCRICEPVPSD